MNQEVPPTPSSVRAGGGGRLFSKAIARSTSKRHKGHVPSASVPFTFTVDKDAPTLKIDGGVGAEFPFPNTAKDKDVTFSGIKLEIPQNIQAKSPASANSASANSTPAHSAVSATMTVAPFGNNLRRETIGGKATTPIYPNGEYGQSIGGSLPNVPPNPNATASGPQHPGVIYQHVQDMASKRISTLDYLRKAHEGRIYWFNTVHFSKQDLSRLPYFEPRKLSRRATNYLLLGLSLPTILDGNSSNPLEYLRTLNALLLEFESFRQIHPPDGGSASSLSRARIPHMFKRATHVGASTKGRRTSSATEIGLPMQSSDPAELKSLTGSIVSSASSFSAAGGSVSSFPSGAESVDLLPGEEYIHLLTPSLPFDPDFYETFATLCDVLIDCYTRIVSLVSSPTVCTPAVGEAFGKADARLRKVIVAGVVREFEDASRNGAKAELAGVGRVVLGGLM